MELATQIVHVHIHDVGGLRGFHLPHGIEELDSRNAMTAIEQKILQQREFFICKLDRVAASTYGVVQAADLQISCPQEESRLAFSAKQRSHPRSQFVQTEWLYHQV